MTNRLDIMVKVRRQNRLLVFIHGYINENDEAPNIDEMAAALGSNYATAQMVFGELESGGFIERVRYYPRRTWISRLGTKRIAFLDRSGDRGELLYEIDRTLNSESWAAEDLLESIARARAS